MWRTEFKPVPLVEGPGRFFNQCIQKKGKAFINKNHLVHAIKNDLDRLDSKEKVQLTTVEKKLKKEVRNQTK